MATHLKNCLTSLRTLLHQVLQRPAEISCHPLCLPEEMLFLSFVVCYDSVLVTFDVIFLTAKKIKLVSSMLKQASQSGPQFIDKKNKQTVYIYFYAFSRRFYPKQLTGYTYFHQYVCSLGIEPTTFCAANAMLYHWATGTVSITHLTAGNKIDKNQKQITYNCTEREIWAGGWEYHSNLGWALLTWSSE